MAKIIMEESCSNDLRIIVKQWRLVMKNGNTIHTSFIRFYFVPMAAERII